MRKPISPSFASLVQEFFTDYMTRQRVLSPQTLASYRDSFVLLLRFAEQTLDKPSCAVELADLQPEFITRFLDHLECERGNSPRSRNIRLAALRSFLKFASRRDVANLRIIEQALTVPMKRFDRKMVGFLTREQAANEYARLTGRDLPGIRFHRTLGIVKLGVIFLQLHALHTRGAVSDPRYIAFGPLAAGLLAFALDVAAGRKF